MNSFFIETAMSLSEASTVLPVFVRLLGGSNLLAGLLPSLRWAGWVAPQFLAAGHMQGLERFIPTVQRLGTLRGSLYVAIAVLAFTLGGEHPAIVLAAFFVLFMITRFAAGTSAVARNEIVAKIVPRSERATLVSRRQLAGGVAGFLSGLAVRFVLDENALRFPANYAVLIGMSGVSFLLATLMWRSVHEPASSVTPREGQPRPRLRQAPNILRSDRTYLRYILVRAAASGMTLALPFYILYAVDVLGAPAAMAGVYISSRTLSRILSNVFWARKCRTRGNLWVFRASLGLSTLAPFSAIALSIVVAAVWRSAVPSWSYWLFSLIFLVQGLASSASGVGQTAYLYDISPVTLRPTYYGLDNTLLGPLYFLPALGGAVLDHVGYASVFGIATALIGVSLLLSLGLRGVHAERGSLATTSG